MHLAPQPSTYPLTAASPLHHVLISGTCTLRCPDPGLEKPFNHCFLSATHSHMKIDYQWQVDEVKHNLPKQAVAVFTALNTPTPFTHITRRTLTTSGWWMR